MAAALLGLSACSSSPRPTSSTSAGSSFSASPPAPPTTPSAETPSPRTPTATTPAPTSSASAAGGGPQNLLVTNDIRAQLLAAGAANNHLPVSDYTGLRPGQTYYALDPATGISWAGAALDPSPSSLQAQVAAQDDGSYFVFEKTAGGSWVAQTDGLGGIQGSRCPLPIPAAVLTLWRWPAGTCRPPAA